METGRGRISFVWGLNMTAKNRTLEASIVDDLLDYLEAHQKKLKHGPIGIQNGSEIEKRLWLRVAKYTGPLQERITALEGVLAQAYAHTASASASSGARRPDWMGPAEEIVTDPLVHGSSGTGMTWCEINVLSAKLPVRKKTPDAKLVTCIPCLDAFVQRQQHQADEANQHANFAKLRVVSLKAKKEKPSGDDR